MTTTPGTHRSNEPAEVPEELREARATIDNIDAALVHLLAERFRCTKKVGVLKARLDLPPADPGREDRQVAEEAGLDPVFAEKFLKFIVEEVIRHHEDIADTLAGERAATPGA